MLLCCGSSLALWKLFLWNSTYGKNKSMCNRLKRRRRKMPLFIWGENTVFDDTWTLWGGFWRIYYLRQAGLHVLSVPVPLYVLSFLKWPLHKREQERGEKGADPCTWEHREEGELKPDQVLSHAYKWERERDRERARPSVKQPWINF